ncbi:RNA polymerase subunit sigma-70 [Sinomicrobium soli]|nr:RNA polymerase subunit sigma-70 [Sinomicrobium sp. N-1-3-6]
MFYIARRYLKREEDAEDAVQDAFILAFRKLHQYREEVSFGAWLKRIVINCCLDRIKMEREHTVSIDGEFLQVADELPGDWVAEDHITSGMVVRAIESLPDSHRYVLMLFLMEGYDHEEIAGILGISEVNSRTLLFRGKKKLQHILKTYRAV